MSTPFENLSESQSHSDRPNKTGRKSTNSQRDASTDFIFPARGCYVHSGTPPESASAQQSSRPTKNTQWISLPELVISRASSCSPQSLVCTYQV